MLRYFRILDIRNEPIEVRQRSSLVWPPSRCRDAGGLDMQVDTLDNLSVELQQETQYL